VTPKKPKKPAPKLPDEIISKSQLKRRKHQQNEKEAEQAIKEYKKNG
jgi:hypothetical protein